MTTAEEFLRTRFELPEGGRWTELVAGELRQFTPPNPQHGTVVLNLSKTLAEFLQQTSPPPGALCFDLGLVVGRNPDTVLFPAAAFFAALSPFELTGEEMTDIVPHQVIEIASSNDRRRSLSGKVEAYLAHGVREVWVTDPHEQCVTIIATGGSKVRFETGQQTTGSEILPDLRLDVTDLFSEPEWWSNG